MQALVIGLTDITRPPQTLQRCLWLSWLGENLNHKVGSRLLCNGLRLVIDRADRSNI